MISQIDLGDAIVLEGRFTNSNGTLTDPTTVALTVRDPLGIVTTYLQAALTHVSTGIWDYTLTPGSAGAWTYTFTGTGTLPTVQTGYFLVAAGAATTVCAPWASPTDLLTCHTTTASEGVVEAALATASDLLWRWSGYKFPGLCQATVRPCAQNVGLVGAGASSPFYPTGFPYGWGYGSWSWIPAWGFCSCQSSIHRSCGCSWISEIRLGRAPIAGIIAVKVDGLTLVPNVDYRVDDYEWLVRLPSTESWPCCQDLSLDDTHDDTFSVNFIWGRNPPPSGVSACVDLAWEIVKACPDGDCAGPDREYIVQRQGTSMTFIAPERYGLDGFGNFRIGLKSVDRFLAAVGTSRPGMLVSPDIDADTRRVAT